MGKKNFCKDTWHYMPKDSTPQKYLTVWAAKNVNIKKKMILEAWE
jgi:hypothetical protein